MDLFPPPRLHTYSSLSTGIVPTILGRFPHPSMHAYIHTSLTFAMGTRDSPAAAEEGTGGGEEEDDDGGVDCAAGVGLADLASCSACRDFSNLTITALWSVWMQLNLQARASERYAERMND